MTGAASDRNLLVGILAVQMDFIRREQLIAAMHAWVMEKHTPLEVLLERQGALDRQTRELLEALVAKHLALHDNNPEKSLQAVSSVGSVKEELRSIADPDVVHSLAHMSADIVVRGSPDPACAAVRGSPDPAQTIPPTIGALTSEGQRFRILRPHAKGGLGEVHVALDTELNREVALKEIQASHADRPDSRARFTLEAEITGGLEHPGIVPVYGLGTYADGRPYYAMRFIRGDSLKDAIDRFHRVDWSGKEGERSLALRKLLGRFIDVCNAIAYAHNRGVLHRDLKPGNIMLGKYGETLVVDWGLAKSLARSRDSRGTSDDELASTIADEPLLRPSSGSGSAPTQMGSALGTPAYMSPEQAAGRLHQLGPASDVYSLGATLYHILTGQPPFAGTIDMGELLRKVQSGAFSSPRSQNQNIPRPLEAICLKAMALKPPDRYGTPARLAEDIEHWLADEPVTAVAESFVERSSRFVRKHKSWTMATAATIAVVALVSTAAALAINQKRAENAALADDNLELANAEKIARQAADERRKEAETLAQEKSKLASDMRIELAKSNFAHGLTEYDAGRVGSADRDFVRALARLPVDHELRHSLEQVAWDRVTHRGRSTMPPMRHESGVTSAQLSPDGNRVITASLDKTARVWDAQTGAAISEPLQHEYRVTSAEYSPDGKRVVTASADNTAQVWDAQTGVALGEPMRHYSGGFVSPKFSPDGKRVVTASYSKTAQVWEAHTGAALGEPMRHQSWVKSAQFSPDGKHVITASGDNTARLWDAATGAALGQPLRHEDQVTSAQFSQDGKRVVTASWDKTARVWDASTGVAIGEPLRHEDRVTSAEFSQDGKRVVTASYDKTARVWDAITGAALGEPLRHEAIVNSARFSPDGKHLVTKTGNTARVWDAHTGAALGEPMRHESGVTSAQFSPDGKRVVTAGYAKTARVWDVQTNAPLGQPMRHEDTITSAEFSQDGRRVVTAGFAKTARVWNVETGAPLGEPMRHENIITSAQFSLDGKRVVTASVDATARLWDTVTGTTLGQPMRHAGEVNSAQFSPDGKRVVTASRDRTVRIWDAASGAALGQVLRHDMAVTSAQFSPDGTQVVTASEDNTVRIWDAATGAALGEPMRHEDTITSAQFSQDGKRVVTAGFNNPAQVWDAATGVALGEPLRHESGVTSAQFSPDGKCVVTAGYATARVWDVQTSAPLGEPMRHEHQVTSAEFSQDGKRVVTASYDKTARVWDAISGAALGEPLHHGYHVNSAKFSSDGHRVLTTSQENVVRIWDVQWLAPDRGWSLAAMSLWTGLTADEQGRIRELTPTEWSSLAAKFHSSNDPWPVALRAWHEHRRNRVVRTPP